MRKFSTDAPEFFSFKIDDSDKVYKVPLAASMPAGILLSMQDADQGGDSFRAQMNMLRRYMGDDVDELTAQTISDILQAWAEASKDQGATVGESQALSD